jgi:hypothetical protein
MRWSSAACAVLGFSVLSCTPSSPPPVYNAAPPSTLTTTSVTTTTTTTTTTTLDPRWAHYATDAEAREYYFDMATLRRAEEGWRVWTMIVELGGAYGLVLFDIDCPHHQMRRRQGTEYYPRGGSGREIIFQPEAWQEPPPSSIWELLYGLICQPR